MIDEPIPPTVPMGIWLTLSKLGSILDTQQYAGMRKLRRSQSPGNPHSAISNPSQSINHPTQREKKSCDDAFAVFRSRIGILGHPHKTAVEWVYKLFKKPCINIRTLLGCLPMLIIRSYSWYIDFHRFFVFGELKSDVCKGKSYVAFLINFKTLNKMLNCVVKILEDI